MIIKNTAELASTYLRKSVLDIVESGITMVLPATIIESAVKYNGAKRIFTVNGDKYDVSRGRIFVIGGGKATDLMAQTLETIISPINITDGIVNCKNCSGKTNKINVVEAGHPVPDERGMDGVKRMLSLKNKYSINENDLVICLISGGGSALMPYPVEDISLKEKQKITELLLSCGADIHEINAVRKHLSRVKGGRLARYFAPARLVSLILSDVIGNNIDVIASGQTCPDSSTFLMAYGVLGKYNLLSKTPSSIVEYLAKGCDGQTEETPKTLTNCHNYILGDNTLALEAMFQTAKTKGFNPLILTVGQSGETAGVAQLRAAEILNGKYAGYDMLLLGGETTLKLPQNPGKGGRNQHYAAVSILAMADYEGDWALASVGTDGSDFLPDVAGAIVDNYSLAEVKSKNIDVKYYLDRYDSYNLLKILGNSLVITGDTGTNVGDIIVYVLCCV